jgi:peroxiredoxin Q/BCP
MRKTGLGIKAPDFALRDQDGKLVRLRDLRGKKVVLYFYLRDNTPGCTKEACSFQRAWSKLKSKNTVVLGVSPDSVESHKRFAEKFNLTFPLLADENATVAKKYGVWGTKNMYGRTFNGIIRSTFLIDEEGKVTKQYSRMRVPGHLAQVMRSLLTRTPKR